MDDFSLIDITNLDPSVTAADPSIAPVQPDDATPPAQSGGFFSDVASYVQSAAEAVTSVTDPYNNAVNSIQQATGFNVTQAATNALASTKTAVTTLGQKAVSTVQTHPVAAASSGVFLLAAAGGAYLLWGKHLHG